jgi:hypothetical protein
MARQKWAGEGETNVTGEENSDSGEALNKKWHELEGWQLEHRHGWGNPIWIRRLSLEWAESAIDLPALHLDTNLAIAAANRVFKAGWFIEHYPDAEGQYDYKFEPEEASTGYRGATPCEAILIALIATKEKR